MRTLSASFLTLAALAASCILLPSVAHADELPVLAPTQSFSFETAPVRAEPAKEWNSPALAVTGSVIAGLGSAAIVTGAVIYGNDDCREVDSPTFPVPCMHFGQAIGGITMLAGGGLVLIGAPMIVAGAWQVESDDRGIPPTTAELQVGPARADVVMTW